MTGVIIQRCYFGIVEIQCGFLLINVQGSGFVHHQAGTSSGWLRIGDLDKSLPGTNLFTLSRAKVRLLAACSGVDVWVEDKLHSKNRPDAGKSMG